MSYFGESVSKEWVGQIKERVLLPGEHLIGAIKGSIESEWMPLTTEIDKTRKGFVYPRNGALCLTQNRILFYMPKLFGRWEVETAPLEQVSSIQFTKGMLQGRIHLTVFNDEKVIKWVDNREGEKIVKLIQAQMDKLKGTRLSQSTSEPEDPLAILKVRLARGEITKQEYEELRKTIEN